MALVRPGTEPLRLYAEDDARLPRRLDKTLRDKIETLSESVLNGQLNERDYRFFTGQITGLREALSECERIAKELGGN
jgi:hypothetical protein